MARRSGKPLPVDTWICPHCQHVHYAADLLRLDFKMLQCVECKKPFAAATHQGTQQ